MRFVNRFKSARLQAAPLSSTKSVRLYRPLKKSILQSILGGAALQRCDSREFFRKR